MRMTHSVNSRNRYKNTQPKQNNNSNKKKLRGTIVESDSRNHMDVCTVNCTNETKTKTKQRNKHTIGVHVCVFVYAMLLIYWVHVIEISTLCVDWLNMTSTVS